MKSLNFFLIATTLLLSFNLSFAQSDKENDKATKSTDKLAAALASVNPSLALSEAQREQIFQLQLQDVMELSAFRKNNPDKAAAKTKTKELRRALTTKINDEILTPEQVKAYKQSKKKMKASSGKEKIKGEGKSKKKSKVRIESPVLKSLTAEEVADLYASASEKQKTRAEERTENLNAGIIATKPNLALSEDQRKQINALNLQRILERAKLIDAGVEMDEVNSKNKELLRSTYNTVLTILSIEQRDAHKANKKKK